MICVILFFLTLMIFIGLIYVKTKPKSKFANDFPGPPTFPILGNIFNYSTNNHEAAKRMIDTSHAKYGDIYRVKIFHIYHYMIADPKIYQTVLSDTTHHLNKNSFYDFLKIWMGNGLVVSGGEYWRHHRKIITPTFHFTMLEQFVDVFDRQSQILVTKLKPRCDNIVFDIVPYILRMAIDVVFETAMGEELRSQDMPDVPYLKATDDLSQILSLRFYSMWRRNDFIYSTFGCNEFKKLKESIKIIHDFADNVIVKRRNRLLKNKNGGYDQDQLADENVKTSNNPTNNNGKNIPFLDIMLQATINGKPLTNDEIKEEVNTFMFAGHDTSTTAISLILWALSRHGKVQDKVFKEILLFIGADKTAPVTYSQLQELKYLDAVIKETFRMFPVIPIIGRYLDKDVVLDDGRIIPADTNVFFNFYLTFKDQRYFENPKVFDPERFTTDTTNDSMPFIFIPFSAGTRNCVGQKYAMLELKAVVSKVLRYYELEPRGDEPNIAFELVARSINGIQLGLSPRIY